MSRKFYHSPAAHPNNGMHPTADTPPVIYFQCFGAAGDAGRWAASLIWRMGTKEFLTNIGSIYWWVSVVVVGILINLFSAYLKSRLDKSLSNASSWWRKKSEAQKSRRKAELEELRANYHKQFLLALSEFRDRFRSIMFLLLGVTLFSLAIFAKANHSSNWEPHYLNIFLTISMTLGSVSFLLGISMVISAMNKMALLREASEVEESQ